MPLLISGPGFLWPVLRQQQGLFWDEI